MRQLMMVVAWCVSATALGAQESRLKVSLPGIRALYPIEDAASTDFEIDASAGATYTAAIAALKEWEVPVTVADSLHGVVGNAYFDRRGSFGGMQLARSLDCGSNVLGETAARARIYMALVALIDPASPTVTRLRIGYVGGAVDDSGSSTQGISCGSRGVLEGRLVDLIKKKLK